MFAVYAYTKHKWILSRDLKTLAWVLAQTGETGLFKVATVIHIYDYKNIRDKYSYNWQESNKIDFDQSGHEIHIDHSTITTGNRQYSLNRPVKRASDMLPI